MAQHDMNIANQSFPDFRTDLNNALSSINSMHSGTSRPSGAVAGTMWLDTTSASSPVIKFFDGSDDITFATVDYSANTINFSDSASDLVGDTTPQLGGQLDVNGNAIGDGTLELLKFIETASAVNELTITNSATGNSPELSATGDDSNIDLKLKPKGTGNIEVMGATNPGSIQLNCESNSHGIILQSPPHSSGQSYTLKFPTGNVTADRYLRVASVSGSGATGVGQLDFAEVSGGGISWQSTIVTGATQTVEANKGYWIDTTSNACTVTLPSSASVGNIIELSDYARKWGINAVTINQNGLKFQGFTSPNPVYNTSGQSVKLIYSGATKGWIPNVDDDVTLETPQTYDIDFLVVAGGGGSGRGNIGGSGAGGLRTATESGVSTGVTITVTVGAGGTYANPQGTNGSVSSFSGTGLTTIESAGGGKGGSGSSVGGSGGSGGGAGYDGSAGSGNSPATSPSQGNNGGGGQTASPYRGGGGGGAGATGTSGGSGGHGGNGSQNSITGSAVYYAGGGGASVEHSATKSDGGSGGGGHGGNGSSDTGTNGTANTGGGGGGGYLPYLGKNGGSGVVILSVPTASYSSSVTGSPTVTTSGSNTIIKFTGSGTYVT